MSRRAHLGRRRETSTISRSTWLLSRRLAEVPASARPADNYPPPSVTDIGGLATFNGYGFNQAFFSAYAQPARVP